MPLAHYSHPSSNYKETNIADLAKNSIGFYFLHHLIYNGSSFGANDHAGGASGRGNGD